MAVVNSPTAAAAAPAATEPEPAETAEPEGPFPPYYCDRLSDVCNPFQPTRPPGTKAFPHVYPLTDAQPYYKALRVRKTQAYHEYQYLHTQLDFGWDRLQLWKEVFPTILNDAGNGAGEELARGL